MPHDENVAQLLARHARSVTDDIVAPPSWSTTVPARANARRRRTRQATAVIGTLAAAGVAASIVVPQVRDGDRTMTPQSSTRLAAYTFVLADRAAHTATEQLPCFTGMPPVQPGSSSALSVGGTGAGAAPCSLLEGRRESALPADARPVPGRGGHVYLGTSAADYRLGYRTYDDPAGGSPLVLQIAVGRNVSSTQVIDLLESIALAPRSR